MAAVDKQLLSRLTHHVNAWRSRMVHRVLIESSTGVRRLYAGLRATVMCRSAIELGCSLDRLHEMNELASYLNNICFVETAQYET